MRKLAWASVSFALGIFAVHYLNCEAYIGMIIAGLAVVGLCGALLLRGNHRTRVVIACVFAIFGMIRYEWQVAAKIDSCTPYVGQVHEITAVVTEFPDVYENSTRVTVKVLSGELPKLKGQFYVYDQGAENLRPGDLISGTVKVNSALLRYGDESDTYISKGIYLRGYFKEVPSHDGHWNHSWQFVPTYLAQLIRNTVDTYVPEDADVFMKALLTGDKSALYDKPEIYHTLTKSGIAHIVAVSGMHVGFVVAMVMMLLGNHRGWIVSVLCIALFAVMTGLSPSVIRAVFMQSLYLAAPIFRREPDGITSLSFALLILLLVNPFSVASISLQLSFASMLGIIVLTPRMMSWFHHRGKSIQGLLKKVYGVVTASFASSLGATVFTAPLCAYHFGSIAIFAPITNLLVLWAVPYCFGMGFIVCAASLVSSTAASVLGTLLALLVEGIYFVAGGISSIPFASVYLPSVLMAAWFVFAYSVVGITYLRRGKQLYRPMVPCLSAMGLLLVFAVGIVLHGKLQNTVAVIDVGQGQSVALCCKGETVLVDCGGEYDAGETTAAWLYTNGRYDIDALLLTHFDEDHVNGVVDLMSQIPVRELVYNSRAITDEQSPAYHEILEYAQLYGVRLRDLCYSTTLSYGEIDMYVYASGEREGNNGLMALATIGTYDALITGDADTAAENRFLRSAEIPNGELLVVGHHGSKYSTGTRLLEAFSPDTAVISVGYNHYGHPTEEVLDRLRERNVVVYRTDEQGTIEIKVR